MSKQSSMGNQCLQQEPRQEDKQRNSSFTNYNCGTCQRDSLTGSCEISVQSLRTANIKSVFVGAVQLHDEELKLKRSGRRLSAFVCLAPCVTSSSRGRYSCLTVMGVFGSVCEWVRAHVTWGVDVETNSELLTS